MWARTAFNAAWATGWTSTVSGFSVLQQVVSPDPARFRRQTRFWARGLAFGTGIRVHTYGAWRLEEGRHYLLMANHQSLTDVLALFIALPMVPGFVAKSELRRVPIFGQAMEVGGHVFLQRGRHREAVRALRNAAEEIRAGKTVVVFPEGTRASRLEVQPFKRGVFHLAKQAQVPVVPVGIRGSADRMPRGSVVLRPGPIQVHVGQPIEVDRVRALSRDELMGYVRSRICELSGLPPSRIEDSSSAQAAAA